MPKNWRAKFVKGHDGPSGREPEYGAIFMSSSSTRKECLSRGLFGLPYAQAHFVKQVKRGMVLFLFDYETRQLHGVFQACSDGAMNIVPSAFCSSGKQFPAQVKFIEIWHCRPLPEGEFRDAIRENYFSGQKFNFGLSEVQVQRLLTLFSSKKLERSSLMKNAALLPTGHSASDFRNASGGRCFQSDTAIEPDGVTERELDFTFALPGNYFADSRNSCKKDSSMTAFCSSGIELDIGQECDTATGIEHPGDASGDFRGFTDHRVPGAMDLLGNECGMDSKFARDATNCSHYSLITNFRFPENLRRAESGWSETEYHGKDDIAQVVSTKYPSLWSNFNQSSEHPKVSIVADPQVLVPRRVTQEPSHATNRETCNLAYPRRLRDATITNSLPYDPDTPGFSSMDLSSCGVSPDPASGDYADILASEKVQQFPDEHRGASKQTVSVFGLGDYVPLPNTHLDYPNSTSMIGVQRFPDEHSGVNKHTSADFGLGDYVPLPGTPPHYPTSTSMIGVVHHEAVPTKPFENGTRRGHSHHLPHPDFLTSMDSGENMSNSKSLSFSSRPCMYPSILHHLSSGDGVDLLPNDRVTREIPAHQSEHDFRNNAPDFNNRAGWAQDHVNSAALNTQSSRRSVFSRLALPQKECDTKRDTSDASESVDEVMTFLHECHEHWLKKKELGSNTSNLVAVGKFEMKKRKSHTAEILDDDPMPLAEAALNDVLVCEENMEQPVQKPPFIDFKRRSERQKSLGNLTQGCKDSSDDLAPRYKKRKLVRPKLIREEPSMETVNHENKVDNGEVQVIKPEYMSSKNHPNEEGNADGHNEEMLKGEEAEEDTLTL